MFDRLTGPNRAETWLTARSTLELPWARSPGDAPGTGSTGNPPLKLEERSKSVKTAGRQRLTGGFGAQKSSQSLRKAGPIAA